jgi:hypothetical protein
VVTYILPKILPWIFILFRCPTSFYNRRGNNYTFNNTNGLGIAYGDKKALTYYYDYQTPAKACDDPYHKYDRDRDSWVVYDGKVRDNIRRACGLFDKEGNFTPWEELISKGIITVSEDGSKVIASSDNDNSVKKQLVGKLVIPSNVKEIGDGAFKNCTGITELVLTNSERNVKEKVKDESNNSIYHLIWDKPHSNITSIGADAFNGCCNLASIDSLVSVKTIGDGAFRGCFALKTIGNIGADDISGFDGANLLNLTDIGDQAFQNCESLTEAIDLPEVLNVGKFAFSGCKASKIVLNDQVAKVGSQAFKGLKVEYGGSLDTTDWGTVS